MADHRRDSLNHRIGSWVKCSGSDSCYVGRQALSAVCIDAAEVGEDETGGDDVCVWFWDAVADEERGRKRLELEVVDVEVLRLNGALGDGFLHC